MSGYIHPREIEISTANLWLSQGAITIDHYGNENTYYIDQFDNRFFCKNYPQKWTDNNGIHHSI